MLNQLRRGRRAWPMFKLKSGAAMAAPAAPYAAALDIHFTQCVYYIKQFLLTVLVSDLSNDASNFYRVGTTPAIRCPPTYYHEFIVREDCH